MLEYLTGKNLFTFTPNYNFACSFKTPSVNYFEVHKLTNELKRHNDAVISARERVNEESLKILLQLKELDED